jgi:hypothetical protein
MNTTRWVAALGAVVVLAVAGYVAVPAIQRSAEQTAVRTLVTDFGKQLQTVSLSATSDDLAVAIDANYARYVAPELLSQWKSDSSLALGRQASSPWPDRIEVASVTRNDDGSYHVEGTVVEITSEEKSTTGTQPAATYPVHITVGHVEGSWLITSLDKGSYSELPQVVTLLGVYSCLSTKDISEQGLACVPGIDKVESHLHYALDLSLLSADTLGSLQTGTKIEVTGTLVPIALINSTQWKNYELEGVIQVTDLKKK